MRVVWLVGLAALAAQAQGLVEIRVDGAATIGAYTPIYSYFGYDEPNYTYMPDGRKLVGELAALSPRAGLHPRASPAGAPATARRR